MAGARLYDSSIYSYAREEVRVTGKFTLTTTPGALASTAFAGRGIKSIVASTTTAACDTYTVTFSEKFPQLLGFVAELNSDAVRTYFMLAGKTYTVVAGDGNGSTLVIRVSNAAGTALTAPTAGDVCSFEAIFENQVFS